MPKSIFIKIASYRDPELTPTIKDCMGKADRPENLRFGICWQHGEGETLPEVCKSKSGQFRIVEVPWQESKGLGWARDTCQRLYDGEDYALQLDAHHRFAPGWDTALIDMLHSVDSELPILSSHPPPYNPETNTLIGNAPAAIDKIYFTQWKAIRFSSSVIENWENLTVPIRARFMAGGFYFTLGRHCMDYQYDPEMYFEEEEISLTLRSYTMGYDLFHPHRPFVWHHYSTGARHNSHSKDHSAEALAKGIVGPSLKDRKEIGVKRLEQLLGVRGHGIDLGIYSIGSKRTISDYEQFAGVKFKEQLLHIDLIRGTEPPCSISKWGKDFSRTRTFSLDFKTSNANGQLLSKQTNKIWVVLAGIEKNIAWLKKLNAREIRNAVNSQRIKAQVTFTPKERVVRWIILAKNGCKWEMPIIIPVEKPFGNTFLPLAQKPKEQ
jgi:hypothetical protein